MPDLALPDTEIVTNHGLADLRALDVREGWQIETELRGLGKQLILAAEVADHQRRIDLRDGGDLAHGGAIEALLAKELACGLHD